MKTINFDFDNLGGLSQLFAVPPGSFVRIRKDYIQKLNYLELRKRDDIISIPVYADDTYMYNEDKETTDAGDSWSVSVEGVVPKNTSVNTEVIEILERGAWYVLAIDSNGEVHWCGQEETLMIFNSQKTSGQSATARNGIIFTFSCVQDEPTVFITDFEEL